MKSLEVVNSFGSFDGDWETGSGLGIITGVHRFKEMELLIFRCKRIAIILLVIIAPIQVK